MASPFVRRRRLASELRHLRVERGFSADKLAKEVGVARQRISRLENGHVRPDLAEIALILRALDIDQELTDQLMLITRDAQERGWWTRFSDEMGPRQALYADLEAGACAIAEYQMTLLPGLLQIPTFTEARARADLAGYPASFNPERALEARVARQERLERHDGPTYDVIIDELAIRRPAAPPTVVAAQLDHLVDAGHRRERITIRVLRLDATIHGYAVPRSPFFTYRYPDPGDPVVVAVDTVASDLVISADPALGQYLALYERLRDAALSPSDSLDYLAAVVEALPHETWNSR